MPASMVSELVLGGRPDLVLGSGGAPKSSAFTIRPCVRSWPRMPTMKVSMSAVFASMTAFMSGR